MGFKKDINKDIGKRISHNDNNEGDKQTPYLGDRLIDNINKVKKDMNDSSDLSIRLVQLNNHIKYAILFIKNLIEERTLNSISTQLMELNNDENNHGEKNNKNVFNLFYSMLLGCRDVTEGDDYDSLYSFLLNGNTLILVDGCNKFIAVNTYHPEGREVDEPTSQTVIRGSKEAFVEKIDINISLIRKRIKSKSLVVENLTLGDVTNTTIMLMYIEHLAKKDIIHEIKRRLKQIKIDGVLDSGYIEELIKDDPFSIFPTFLNSEKPDAVSGALLEGRVAIFVDGTPYVLTAPCLFNEFFQVSEDYFHNFIIASMVRLIRYLAFFLTLLVPAFYIALTTFHQEMIPTPLLISIAAQREGVPFPAFVEAAIMLITFEILQEAGIRMPRAVGPAISIAGALVIGQAAVEAGIISAVMVIVVSITAISSFAITNYSMANGVRVLRFLFMILASIYGLYGIFMGLIILTLHLSKLKSIGIPYLTPMAPMIKGQNKDTILRAPLWTLKFRPVMTQETNELRINMGQPVESIKKDNQELR